MKKTAIVTVILIAIFLLFWVAAIRSTDMGNSDFKNLEQAIMDAQPDENKLKNEILPQLNRAIEDYPDDARLTRHRLTTLVNLGLLEKAQKDAARLIELADSVTVRFVACGLAESLGNITKEASLQCYRDLYIWYSSKVNTIDSWCPTIALMGEMPEAEKIQAEYLKSEPSEELRRWYAENFIPFKRENFLYSNRGEKE